MAEVTSGQIHEVVKSMQERMGRTETTLGAVKSDIQSVRMNAVSMPQDLMNPHRMLGRRDARLNRIERRLDLREPERA